MFWLKFWVKRWESLFGITRSSARAAHPDGILTQPLCLPPFP